MKRLLCIVILALVQTVSAAPVRLANEIQLGLPDGWQLMGDTVGYPFLLMPGSRDAELLIFKSSIERSATIDDHQALRMSVDRVIDSVVMTLPNAKLLTTTGLYEGDHARFTVEFTSEESVEEGMYRHSLTGILYRLASGDQVLFTLWARSSLASFPQHQEAITAVARDFTFIGAHETDIFVARQKQPFYYAIPIALALSLFVLIQVRRKQKSRRLAAGEPWHCPCGAVNDPGVLECARCGQLRTTEKVAI